MCSFLCNVFLCNGCKNMFCNRVGIAAVELKLQGCYEIFVQSLGKLDIYITLPLERERIVSNLYYIFYSFYVTVTLLSFVYNSEVL